MEMRNKFGSLLRTRFRNNDSRGVFEKRHATSGEEVGVNLMGDYEHRATGV